MDNPRHRQILRALRPHGADRHDPEAQPALAAAREDPALAAWFAREQAFDQGFSERIQSVTAPDDLRASIFAAVETARPPATRAPTPRRWIVQRPVATTFAALAAAASLALLAMLLWPRQVRPVAVEDVIAAAVSAPVDALASPELAGRSLSEVRDWLASRTAPVPGEIPSVLTSLRIEGAGVVVLQGITSSIVTFDAPALKGGSGEPPGRQVALFTLPRQSCSTAGITREPSVREQAGRTIAVWRDATSVYVLAVDASAEDLRRFLAGSRLVVLNGWGPSRPMPIDAAMRSRGTRASWL